MSILASGSSGNCTLLETSRTRLLVDAGLGKRETLRRLAAIDGHALDRLDGIVISHEHSDHIGGLAALLAKWRTTVYFTAATHAETLRILPEAHAKRLERVEFIQAGQRFSVGDIEVAPFAIPHDAVDPLGFTFRAGGVKLAVVTDLGYMPELVKHHLREADVLMLESNHDLEMLKVGPYPWHVKQRVMSRTGHLSNHTVSEFLADPEGFRRAPALSGAGASFGKQQQSRRGAHLRGRGAGPAPRRMRLPRRVAGRLAARTSRPRCSFDGWARTSLLKMRP